MSKTSLIPIVFLYVVNNTSTCSLFFPTGSNCISKYSFFEDAYTAFIAFKPFNEHHDGSSYIVYGPSDSSSFISSSTELEFVSAVCICIVQALSGVTKHNPFSLSNGNPFTSI